jgi:glycosyltransferase 2 family protein
MRRLLRGRGSRAVLVVAGLASSAVFTYLAVRGVKTHDMWRAFRRSNYWWLLPALGALAAGNVLRGFRWRYLFARETRPPYWPVFTAMLIGQFFNNVLPARAGEAARIVYLNRRAQTSRAETVGTVVSERAYDVMCVLLILFVTLPWLPHVSWVRAAAILAVALFAGMVAAFLVLTLYHARPARWLARKLAWLPFVDVERAELAAENLVHGLAALRRPRLVVAAFAWTVASWLTLGMSGWFLMKGFDLGLSPVAAMLVTIAIALGLILPSSPAAVGVFEAAVLIALNAYKIPKSEGLSYALVLHALNFFPYIAAGVLILTARMRALRVRAEASR